MATLPVWTALAAALVPLLAAAGCSFAMTRGPAVRLASFAALPALAAAVFVPDGSITVPWLVSGIEIGIDPTGRAFLSLAAVVWTAAGLYAAASPIERPGRFFGFFSLAMAGNLALCCTTDPAGFYTFFAMMALSTYGLVVHGGGEAKRRAGRVYMAFAVVGEAFLISGLFAIGAAALGVGADLALGPISTALLLVAFGIKMGTVGLHGWLPIAHPVAPTPASAVLSGVMLKAGALGLIRFLPGGEAEAVPFGALVMAFGVASAFYGAAAGVFQTVPKTVLAYSSVSQLGLITVAIGAGLAAPDAWPVAVTAATVYAVHHGLAKTALFLGTDLAARSRRRAPVLVALALPAFALSGLPLTSGAVAKIVLKEATGSAPGAWSAALESLLPVAAVGTTLLMARFLYLVARGPTADRTTVPGMIGIGALGLLLVGVGAALWVWPAEEVRYAAEKSLGSHYLWAAVWPVGTGIAIASAVWAARAMTSRLAGAVPSADVYSPVFAWAHGRLERRERLAATSLATPAALIPAGQRPSAAETAPSEHTLLAKAGLTESALLNWATAISALGVLTVLLLLLALRG